MPYLTFDSVPPISKPTKTTCDVAGVVAQEKATLDLKTMNSEVVISEELIPNAYPAVRLDVETITDATAARLAASLLGHVLFLKNQIPFPVMQLGRIPGGKANSRASKQRTELLASYDTISSHLDTTFSALSTALARCSGSSFSGRHSKVAQAHVAILVGPSLGSAKSKVILGIDGLETRIWGTRDDAKPAMKAQEDSDGSDADEEDDDADDDGDSREASEESGEEPEDSEEEDEHAGEDDEDDDEDDDDEEGISSAPPPPYISYADEQKFLQNADRLLSRTLAAADAEGNGITSEMSPTQTHILIRAPRIFNHPAWIPRQNISAGLDSSLHDFLRDSGVRTADFQQESRSAKPSSKKAKVEGVWVTARAGIHGRSPAEAEPSKILEQSTEDEDSDMIWWSWDGKFVGFADW